MAKGRKHKGKEEGVRNNQESKCSLKYWNDKLAGRGIFYFFRAITTFYIKVVAYVPDYQMVRKK